MQHNIVKRDFKVGERTRKLNSGTNNRENLVHGKTIGKKTSVAEAIDYACRTTDCSPVRVRGVCFRPVTIAHHASFAMNACYQTRGANKWNCDFSNTGLIAWTDPKGSFPKATLPEKQDTWCVAKPGTPAKMLQANIDCGGGELGDCSDIQEQGSCFFPNTLINHTSVVMNLYYKTLRKYNCDFNTTRIQIG